MNANEPPNDGSYGTKREKRAVQKQDIRRQIEQLENRLKQVSRTEQKEARTRDTHYKVVAGALLLADVEAGNTDRAQVAAIFKRAVRRDCDVKLLREEGWPL